MSTDVVREPLPPHNKVGFFKRTPKQVLKTKIKKIKKEIGLLLQIIQDAGRTGVHPEINQKLEACKEELLVSYAKLNEVQFNRSYQDITQMDEKKLQKWIKDELGLSDAAKVLKDFKGTNFTKPPWSGQELPELPQRQDKFEVKLLFELIKFLRGK